MHNASLGQNVSLLYYVDGRPFAVNAKVTGEHPVTLESFDPNAEQLNHAPRALLVIQKGNEFSKAEAQITAKETNGKWTLTASDFGWEQVDRRRYDRYEVGVPVTVRAVIESEDGAEIRYVEATTEDVSLGGAWLKSDVKMESGLLVEFQMNLDGATFKAFSIVRWADTAEKTGFGVEFLDFVAGNRSLLHNWLQQQAA